MNIEHLCHFVSKNFSNLKDKKKTLDFMRYQFNLLAWKKNKLKIGAIVFEIKEFVFHKTVLWEDIEIRYIRQDTTISDEQKLENILKRLSWQWDFRNYVALVVVATSALFYFYYLLKLQYYKYLPSLAFRSEHYDQVLRHSFEICFTFKSVGIFNVSPNLSFWLVDLFTEFCSYFNLIF